MVKRMAQKSDFVTALIIVIGSIGAAVAVSKREQRIAMENARLREQLILARLLSLLGVSFGIGCYLW
jgi:hypothetical protein